MQKTGSSLCQFTGENSKTSAPAIEQNDIFVQFRGMHALTHALRLIYASETHFSGFLQHFTLRMINRPEVHFYIQRLYFSVFAILAAVFSRKSSLFPYSRELAGEGYFVIQHSKQTDHTSRN